MPQGGISRQSLAAASFARFGPAAVLIARRPCILTNNAPLRIDFCTESRQSA